jgi:putative oxidoreductase
MIDSRLAPYGIFILRAALGIMFISHAYLKVGVFGIAGFQGYLAQTGMPTLLAWPIILAELVGGIALLFGIYGRLAAVALMPVLLGAVAVHAPNGWVFNAPGGGWEYPAFLAAAAFGQALIGEGALALKPLVLPAWLSLPAGAGTSARLG